MRDWEHRMLQERLDVVYTPRCACGWSLPEMPLREGKQAFLEHRLDKHPEIQPKPRRKRHRPFGALQSAKSLDDNIANARQQGAAGWAGAE